MLLRKTLLVALPGVVVLFSYLMVSKSVFIIIMLTLLLLWVAAFYLEGIFRVADIPLLYLLLGTFAFGRAFSLIGIQTANLPFYMTEIALGASLVLLLLRGKTLWNEWRSTIPKGLISVLLAYFLLGTLYLAIGVAGNGTLALRDIVFCHYILFLFIALSLMENKVKIKTLMRFFIPGIIIILFIGLIFFFVYTPIGASFRRFMKEAKMTNLSLYYGLVVMFGISFFAFVKNKMKLLIGLIVYLSLLFIIMAEVRAGWVGMIVALIVLSILLKKEFKIVILIFLLLAGSLFIIDHFQLSKKKDKLAKLKEQVTSVVKQSLRTMPGANIKWRMGIWKQLGREILEQPVFGWGYGIQVNYVIWDKRISELKAKGASTGIVPAHNHILAIAYKMGLVGLGLFLFINFRIFFYGLCYIKKCKSEFNRRFLIASLASLVYWHSMAFFFDILESPPTGIFLWILLGAILGVVYVDKNT